MYDLTLTKSERDALSWIGYRYFHGNELIDLLLESDIALTTPFTVDPEWDSNCAITFNVPENLAHAIKAGLEDENLEMACLCYELQVKFLDFIDKIV